MMINLNKKNKVMVPMTFLSEVWIELTQMYFK